MFQIYKRTIRNVEELIAFELRTLNRSLPYVTLKKRVHHSAQRLVGYLQEPNHLFKSKVFVFE